MDYLNSLKENLHIVVVIIILNVLFFSRMIENESNLPLITAILSSSLMVYFFLFHQENSSQNEIKILENKLESLSDNPKHYSHFYTCINMIELFDNFKENFYKFNKRSYINCLICANNVLIIKNETTLNLVKYKAQVDPQDLFNITRDYIDEVEDAKLENITSLYTIALREYKKSMNYAQSMELSIPSDSIQLNIKLQSIVKRLQILLKRNIDIIESSIRDEVYLDHNYAEPLEINKENEPKTSFDFY